MTSADELSHEQRRVLDPAIRVVEAAPGSGKTRAIVARFLQTLDGLPRHRGVALLSFTNAAVDEVRRRASGRPEVINAPNFVGTIDAFLHRFIVTPEESQRLRKAPTYWPSWDALPGPASSVRLRGQAGSGVQLSRFRMRADGEVVLQEDALSWEERTYLHAVGGRRQQLLNQASSVIRGLNRGGKYDANTARVFAYRLLGGPRRNEILERLTLRFEELLIDEAQDCDEPEFSVISALATTIRTVTVADPDQAIFAFRGGDPQFFLRYRDNQAPGARASLTTNYRSTTAICAAVTSLRAGGVGSITAHNSEACPPVFVISGGIQEQRDRFHQLLDEVGVPHDQATVLAYRLSDALQLAGKPPAATSTAVGNRLATSVADLRDPWGTGVQRRDAVLSLESLLLELIQWPSDLVQESKEIQLRALGRTAEWLRVVVGMLVADLETANSADEFGRLSRRSISGRVSGLPFPLVPLGSRVKKPSAAFWSRHQMPPRRRGLSVGTIHSAKGLEFEAVLVGVPENLPSTGGRNVIDDWAGGFGTEPRRVLYVGASRARRLLAFGAGSHTRRIAQLLRDAGTPVSEV